MNEIHLLLRKGRKDKISMKEYNDQIRMVLMKKSVYCPLCSEEKEDVITSYNSIWLDYFIKLHGIKAERCKGCGMLFFTPEEVKMMQELTHAFSLLPNPPKEFKVR